jgi:hypothetical protein
MSNGLVFPSEWPDNCPPSDSDDASGTIYRIVKTNPPARTDILSLFEENRPIADLLCQSCGVSVFRELRDAVHQRKAYRRLGKLIAVATLTAECGKTKLTSGRQPTHTTWWCACGVDRAARFAVVEDV